MSGVDSLTNLNNILRTNYTGARVFDEAQKRAPTWNLFSKDGIVGKWDGKGYRLYQQSRTARSAVVRWDAVTPSAYPSPGESRYGNRYWGVKCVKAAIGCGEFYQLISSGEKYSGLQASNLIASEMKALTDKITELLNKAVFGDGKGTLATVSSFSNSTTDTVTVDSTAHLDVGMVVDFIRSGEEVANAVDVTITAITSETTFECVITGTPASGDIIVMANSYDKCIDGFQTFKATSGTYGGSEISSNYAWRPTVHSNNQSNPTDGNPSNFSSLQFLVFKNKIDQRSGNFQDPNDFICRPEVADAAMWVLAPDRRFTATENWDMYPNRKKMKLPDGGTILIDHDCPKQCIFYFHIGDIKRCQVGEPGWEDTGGGIVKQTVDSSTGNYKNEYVANWRAYLNLVMVQAQKFGYFYNVYGVGDSGSTYGDYGGLS